MIRIVDHRGTGRTSRLILLAKKTGATIVAPSYAQAKHISDLAMEYGIKDIQVITFNDFMERQRYVKDSDEKFLIDNLDEIMAYMGVIGYSELKEERSRLNAL